MRHRRSNRLRSVASAVAAAVVAAVTVVASGGGAQAAPAPAPSGGAALASPTGLRHLPITDTNRVTVSWLGPAGLVYDVYLRRQGGTFTKVVTGTDRTSITFRDLAHDTVYDYYVVARDAAGNSSAPSTVSTFRTVLDPITWPGPGTDTTPPSAPTGLWACIADLHAAVPICWNPATDDVGVFAYDVYMKQPDDSFAHVAHLRTDSGSVLSYPSYVRGGLSVGAFYSFYVVARDADGNSSEPSAVFTARAQQGYGPPPQSPSPSPTPEAGGCEVTYQTNAWPGAFTASITIKNTGPAALNGWQLKFSLSPGERITQGWSAEFTQQGSNVTADNMPWNGTLAPGASVFIGFNAQGSPTTPTRFTLNGVTCS